MREPEPIGARRVAPYQARLERTFVLGDTDEEAHEIAHDVRRRQVSGPHAIMFLEQLWNRDLSEYDPDGPLPDVDPDVASEVRAQGSA